MIHLVEATAKYVSAKDLQKLMIEGYIAPLSH